MHLVVVVTCYKVHKFRNHSENEINEIHFWEPREWKSSAPNLLPGLAGCRQLYRVCLPCRQYWGFFKGDNHHSYLGLVIPPQILVLLDGFCTLNLCLEGAQMKPVFIILMSSGWTGTTTPARPTAILRHFLSILDWPLMTMPVHIPVWKGEFNVTRQQEDILSAIPPLWICTALICIIYCRAMRKCEEDP